MCEELRAVRHYPARNGMETEPAIQANPNALAFLEQFKHVEAMPYIIGNALRLGTADRHAGADLGWRQCRGHSEKSGGGR